MSMKIKCQSCLSDMDLTFSQIKNKLNTNKALVCSNRSCGNRIRSIGFPDCDSYQQVYHKLKYLKSEEVIDKVTEMFNQGKTCIDISSEFKVSHSFAVRNVNSIIDINLVDHQNKVHSDKLKSGEVKTWMNDLESQIKLSPFLNPAWQLDHQDSMKLSNSGFYNSDNRGSWKRSIRGYHYSDKMKTTFRYRSRWELIWYMRLDKDPNVLCYLVEPIAIPRTDSHWNYYPDLLIWYNDNSLELVEIKPIHQLSDPDVIAKAKVATEYCLLNNMEYKFFHRPY